MALLETLAKLLGTQRDPRDGYRPLWHAIVARSRDPGWYREGGVADTLDGRFDMITAILALVIARMGQGGDLARDTAYLTELFVEDMDGQLRQTGIGDPTLGKQVGKMVGALGGRITAYANGLQSAAAMEEAVARNVTMSGDGSISIVAERLRAFHQGLAELPDDDLLAGKFDR